MASSPSSNNSKQHTTSIPTFTSTPHTPLNTERKYTLPHRKDQIHRQLLSFLEPGIFAHNTLLPTQSLQRSNTLGAMASASERWTADPAVRAVLRSQNLTEIEQCLIAGIVPQASIRDEVEAVRGKAPRDKLKGEEYCQGGEEHGVKVRDFAVVKQKVDMGEEASMVARDVGIKEERKGT
ncbi:hypothetical protein CBER1_06219 [Cercospora berteroae]|uniref:Uncharacterized protein n=1 Tax=Cercospora berteroae TaxID=357750 RepID=A0A2S6CME7_9PEZI|nr:hypothetical protein CBER1_06219 [Cercospora berteroae]